MATVDAALGNGLERELLYVFGVGGKRMDDAALEDGTELDLDDMTGVAWIVQGRKQSE